jgi:hypothetical protein
MITFTCCIGDCKHILIMKPRLITEHIKKYHPQAFIQLNCNYIYYCGECDTFTQYIHHHCPDCTIHFNSITDLEYHYHINHKFWFLENDCIYGQDCKKKFCRYNHYMYDKNYIVEKNDIIPESICEYDLPWINIRCNNRYCTRDHFLFRKKM